MKRWIVLGLASGALAAAAMFACGGEEPASKLPAPVTSAPAIASVAPSTVPAPSAVASVAPAASSATVVAPPAMKGTFNSFTRAATSGKVDKVGPKDGDLKPDGVKDQVFDVDYDGAVSALFVMTCDKEGTLTSEFDADTLVGGETIPKEIAGVLNQGRNTAGLAVFEGDKVQNRPNGGVTFAEGKHKLTLYISTKDYPTGPVRVFALLPDGTLVKGPILAK